MQAKDDSGALPEELQQIIRGFQESRAVLSAIELDIFTAVGEGASGPEVARRIGAEARSTEMLLNALAAMGLIEKREEIFSNSPVSARHLAAGGSNDSRAALMHTVHLWTTWSRLTDSVRAGTAVPREGEPARNAAWTEAFIAAMHKNASERAPLVVRSVRPDTARTMLDVGGGSGAYSIAFARANPQLRVDLLDLPAVIPIAQRHIAAAGLQERIRTRGGDLRRDSLGRNYDIIFLSAICHMLSPVDNRDLLRRCFEASAPGGRVVLQDFILEPSKTAPKHAALFALNMLVGTEAGSTYSDVEYAEWMRQAGFTEIDRVRLTGPTSLMIGTNRHA